MKELKRKHEAAKNHLQLKRTLWTESQEVNFWWASAVVWGSRMQAGVNTDIIFMWGSSEWALTLMLTNQLQQILPMPRVENHYCHSHFRNVGKEVQGAFTPYRVTQLVQDWAGKSNRGRVTWSLPPTVSCNLLICVTRLFANSCHENFWLLLYVYKVLSHTLLLSLWSQPH